MKMDAGMKSDIYQVHEFIHNFYKTWQYKKGKRKHYEQNML